MHTRRAAVGALAHPAGHPRQSPAASHVVAALFSLPPDLVGRGYAVDRTGLLGQSAAAQSDAELEFCHVVAVMTLTALAGELRPRP